MSFDEAVKRLQQRFGFQSVNDVLRYAMQEAREKRYTQEIIAIVKHMQEQGQTPTPTSTAQPKPASGILSGLKTVANAAANASSQVDRKLNNTALSQMAFQLAQKDGIDLRTDSSHVAEYMAKARQQLTDGDANNITAPAVVDEAPKTDSKLQASLSKIMRDHGFETPTEAFEYVGKIALLTLKDPDVKAVSRSLSASLSAKLKSMSTAQQMKLMCKKPEQFVGVTLPMTMINGQQAMILFTHYDVAANKLVGIIEFPQQPLVYPMQDQANENYGESVIARQLLPTLIQSLPREFGAYIDTVEVPFATVYNKPDMAIVKQKLYIPSIYNIFDTMSAGPNRGHVGDKYSEEQWQYCRLLINEENMRNKLGRSMAWWLRNPDMYNPDSYSTITNAGEIAMMSGLDKALVLPAFTLDLSK